MKTLNQVYLALLRKNFKNRVFLLCCNFFSILLITAFAVVMQSQTVQNILPIGGDSRKQMVMIFALAVLGCSIFTIYASSLYFKSRSREIGIFMSLGSTKKQIKKYIFLELVIISIGSSIIGMLIGTGLAFGIWQIFRIILVDSTEMIFQTNIKGYLWGSIFAVFTILAIFLMGNNIVNNTNIVDVLLAYRKNEKIKVVKRWYSIVGIALIVIGGFGGLVLPRILKNILQLEYPPSWPTFLYIFIFIGLYMLIVYFIFYGYRKKNYYKNIISISMIKSQGVQTVRNMLILTILVAGMFFSMFYLPISIISSFMEYNRRPFEFVFRYRMDEDMITKNEIEQMAEKQNVEIKSYHEVQIGKLAIDGTSREWDENGNFHDIYREMLSEKGFLNESEYNEASGQKIDVKQGYYCFVRKEDDIDDVYMYKDSFERVTNPTTNFKLKLDYQEDVWFDSFYSYIILDDKDFFNLCKGLDSGWKEKMILFNVADLDMSYLFAKQLRESIIEHSSEKSKLNYSYDRVAKMLANSKGEEYWLDTDVYKGALVDYSQSDSSAFKINWMYNPRFVILDKSDFLLNMGVYLMLFTFISLICFLAVTVIVITRCYTIILNNKQVYIDLKLLGANKKYIRGALKKQVSMIFFIPLTIGSIIIYGFFTVMLLFNGLSGVLTQSEKNSLGFNLVLLIVVNTIFYCIYKITINKIYKTMEIN